MHQQPDIHMNGRLVSQTCVYNLLLFLCVWDINEGTRQVTGVQTAAAEGKSVHGGNHIHCADDSI